MSEPTVNPSKESIWPGKRPAVQWGILAKRVKPFTEKRTVTDAEVVAGRSSINNDNKNDELAQRGPILTRRPTIQKNTIAKSRKQQEIKIVAEEETSSLEENDEDDARLEDDYLSRRTTRNPIPSAKKDDTEAQSSEPEEDDNEDAPPPAHETQRCSKNVRQKVLKKAKYVPPDETPAQKDARTIFVGNIPIAVAKSKSSQKNLKRHFFTLVPGSKIDSVRFRSVAFSAATSTLPAEDGKPSQHKKSETLSTKQQRQQERAAEWRESTETSMGKGKSKRGRNEDEMSDREEQSAKKPAYLSPAERKRVAFIKGEFHHEVDSVNAYVVFAYTDPDAVTSTTHDSSILHPFEAARLAVERGDGTVFQERTMRVDRVGQWRIGVGTEDDVAKAMQGDPRATLFVGNLDFAAKEEELRVWFEGAIGQERGPPGEDAVESEDEGKVGIGVEKRRTWVRSVRIVRDRDTQLGKGFAYVRFIDRDCVDEIMGLEPAKLKFAKRTLRVQRCKVGGSTATSASLKSKPKPPKIAGAKDGARAISTPIVMPKGDPLLGAKLAGLSKDDRKVAKAADVERVKRRLAKKRMKGGVERARTVKERERERPRADKGKAKLKGASKGRVRSERSVEKRNAKK
ncbi:hypothetical protein K439DRAFT_1641486 [Ramaria rubella]|nr:hypothetical protein K439DRAFT_1641486 [Ramaria rubella]